MAGTFTPDPTKPAPRRQMAHGLQVAHDLAHNGKTIEAIAAMCDVVRMMMGEMDRLEVLNESYRSITLNAVRRGRDIHGPT